MHDLEEINLTSIAPRSFERYQKILKLAPNLKNISISNQSINEAKQAFESRNIEIFDITNYVSEE